MIISPAKCDLKHVMKISYRAVAAYQQATPDLGADFSYPDAQLINLNYPLCRFTHSSYSSARSIFLYTVRLLTCFRIEEWDSLPNLTRHLLSGKGGYLLS